MSHQQGDEATPTEDPREQGMGDQMPEENPEGQGAGGGERQGPESGAGGTQAPDTSRDEGPEDDPGRATATPNAAGGRARSLRHAPRWARRRPPCGRGPRAS